MAESHFTFQIISRKQAKAQGLVRYFTGKPCPQGHICERFVSYGQCLDCTVKSRDSWYHSNKDRARAKNAKWHEENRPRKRAINAKYRANNPEKVREATESHRLAFPEKYIEYRANRRARKRNAEGNGISAADIKFLSESQKYRCAYCGEKKLLTLDHIKPLALGGAHDVSNAQMVCKSCNSSKGAKDPFVFANAKGLLF
jgi:5-methylcytosine-specific restriction endonuclease McrA